MKKRGAAFCLAMLLVLSVLPLSGTAAETGEDVPASSLYVQEGLVLLLDAYDDGAASVDLSAGVWHSATGEGAALLGNAARFTREAGGGIAFRQTPEQWETEERCGVFLRQEDVPAGDYTVETVFRFLGLTNADGSRFMHTERDQHHRYGYYTGAYSGFAFGNLRGAVFVAETTGSSSSYTVRWFYNRNDWDASGQNPFRSGDGFLKEAMGDTPIAFALTRTGEGEDCYTATVGDSTLFTFAGGRDGYLGESTDFALLQGVPSVLYSVRVYDRALTEEERHRNHAADLIRYLHLHVPVYAGLSPQKQQAAAGAVAACGFDADPQRVAAALEKEAERWRDTKGSNLYAACKTEYDNLYVQNGLKLLFSAWEKTGALQPEKALWYSVAGEETVAAALKGGAAYWKTNRGVGYRLCGEDPFVSLVLPVQAMPAGAYTLEMAVCGVGMTDGTGLPLCSPDGDTPPTAEAFVFGRVQGMATPFLRSPTHPAGGGRTTRWQAGGTTCGTAELFADGLATVSVVFRPRTGGRTGDMTLSRDGRALLAAMAVGAGGTFVLFRSYPADVYCIRVYDRILTEEETAQNRFADLMAYLSLDVTPYLALSAAGRAQVHAAFAGVSYGANPEKVQAALHTLCRSLAGV